MTTSANIGMHNKLQGKYNLVITRPDNTVIETGWFDNLVLNSGLDMVGTAYAPFVYCQLGTGSSTPVATQTTLDASVASAYGYVSTNVNSGAPNYSAVVTYEYSFAQGAVVGNMAEIGIGPGSTGTLFSRALISNSSGPTTITITAIDQLTVYYQLTITPTITDQTGSFLLSGNNVNYTTRPMNIASFSVPTNGFYSAGSVYAYASDASLAPVTGSNINGTSAGPNSTGPTQNTYTAGSYTLSYSVVWSPSSGNPATMYTSGNSVSYGSSVSVYSPMLMSPDGLFAYILAYNGSSPGTIFIYNVNPSTGAFTYNSSINTVNATDGYGNMAISEDGKSLYVVPQVGFGSYGMYVYSRNTTTGLLTLAGTTNLSGVSAFYDPCITPDGAHLYVGTDNTGIEIYSRNSTTSILTDQGAVSGSPQTQVLISSPDGNFIYGMAYNGTLTTYSRNSSTGALTSLGTTTAGGGFSSGVMCMTADGTSLYFAVYNSSTIYEFSRNTLTGALTSIGTISCTSLGGMSLTPDGTMLITTYAGSGIVYQYPRNTTSGVLSSPTTITGGFRFNYGIIATNTGIYGVDTANQVVGFYAVTSGIGGFRFSVFSNTLYYQTIVSPTILKDSTKTLTINYSVSWGR